jgi:tetratricopeptide (TPR) repeat protein
VQPGRAETYNNLGAVYARMGDLDAAAAEYRAALQRRPDYLNARLNLSQVLARQGKLDEAVRECEAARQRLEASGPDAAGPARWREDHARVVQQLNLLRAARQGKSDATPVDSARKK